MRNDTISKLWEEQNKQCALSGVKTGLMDAHEWLVPRSKYPFPSRQDKIFTPINMIVLCRKEHESYPLLRDYKCAKYKLQWYNFEEIEEWLSSLSLKTIGTFRQWVEYREDILQIPEGEKIKK